MSVGFWTSLLSGMILAGLPLLFASLGETISEQSGVLNIGLEGMMLVGAYAGFVAALYSHSPWVGIIAGIAGGMIMSAIMAVFCVRLGLDQIVVGIAILLVGEGLTSLLHGAQFGTSYPRLEGMMHIKIPLLSEIPVVGSSIFSQPLIFWIGIGMVLLVRWVLRSTNWGLNIRAAGEKPAALDAAGVDVTWTRTAAVLCTGALAGIGGAYMAIVGSGIFVPFMTNGLGFIAIVITMLARGRAWWALGGSFLFGICLQIGTSLQVAGINIPNDVIFMLPFLVVMVVLVIFARQAYLPASLCIPYKRGLK
ncbi:MAG: ABC transporter permease [Acidobacteria bacterium RBG_16_64_8]|nr:MAG: ABC transporter permease [Acidobacteria bacterium RBG_16_64_8]